MRRTLAGLAIAAAFLLGLAAPAHATDPAACEAYVNLCAQFPGDQDRDCPEIGHPVTLVNKDVDPWQLDADGDGIGCEVDATTTPTKKPSPKPSKTPTHKATKSPAPAAAAKLPVTGPPVGALVGAGAGVLVLGAGGVWLARRRRTRFTA